MIRSDHLLSRDFGSRIFHGRAVAARLRIQLVFPYRTSSARRRAVRRDGRAPPITSDGRALRLQSELRVPQVYSRVHVDRTTGRHRHHRGPGEPAVAGTQQSQSPGVECRLPKQSQTTPGQQPPVCARPCRSPSAKQLYLRCDDRPACSGFQRHLHLVPRRSWL